ncbi:MAG: hypothetical protein ACO32I_07140 [Candidatus Limnocylindrus sp.]
MSEDLVKKLGYKVQLLRDLKAVAQRQHEHKLAEERERYNKLMRRHQRQKQQLRYERSGFRSVEKVFNETKDKLEFALNQAQGELFKLKMRDTDERADLRVQVEAEWQRRCDAWREQHPDASAPSAEVQHLVSMLAAMDYENTRLQVEGAQLRAELTKQTNA